MALLKKQPQLWFLKHPRYLHIRRAQCAEQDLHSIQPSDSVMRANNASHLTLEVEAVFYEDLRSDSLKIKDSSRIIVS